MITADNPGTQEGPYYHDVILYYKVNPCMSLQAKSQQNPIFGPPQPCNSPTCYGYHSIEERRRPVINQQAQTLYYQAFFCPSVEQRTQCPDGENCKFCHTQNELRFHPRLYKCEPCSGCNMQKTPNLCPLYHKGETPRRFLFQNNDIKKNNENAPKDPMITPADFDLDSFKTSPCSVKGNHNPKFCLFFHHDKDRRRPTSQHQYSSDMCPVAQKGQKCHNGDDCRYSHNKVEQLYHPDRYKKKFCTLYPHNTHKCDYGNYCSFAHSDKEIEIELLHNYTCDEDFYIYKYKTVYCPYIYDHDRSQCVYAHNPQDYRRDPLEFQYEPVHCPNWSQGPIFSYEDGGCRDMQNCTKCHGWKELEFHPKYFKTRSCTNGVKCSKKDCPFFHSVQEKRDSKDLNDKYQQKLVSGGNNNNQQQNFFNTPQKQQQQNNFIIDPFEDKNFINGGVFEKKRFNKKMDTNYRSPVMPIHSLYSDSPDSKQKHYSEISTRPNSHLSSAIYSEDDMDAGKKAKKRKVNRKSVEFKKERIVSPVSTGSEKMSIKMPKYPNYLQIDNNIWNPRLPEKEEKHQQHQEVIMNWDTILQKDFDDRKAKDGSQESLKSYSNDKDSLISDNEKPCQEIKVQSFKKVLEQNLNKNNLSYSFQHLTSNAEVDFETLKSFGTDKLAFHFPQLAQNDLQKIAQVIEDTNEEIETDMLMYEINTVTDQYSHNGREQEEHIGSFDSNYGNLLQQQPIRKNSAH